MIYPTKKDKWQVYLLVMPGILALFAWGFISLYLTTTHRIESPVVPLTGIMMPVVGLLMLLAIFGTKYEITPSDLIVKEGIRSHRIPLKAIEEVSPTPQGVVSRVVFIGLDASRSMDSLCIKYRRLSGKTVLAKVSPKDKGGFFQALAQGAGLQVSGDRAVRPIPG
jgi:Bacterial PH domain